MSLRSAAHRIPELLVVAVLVILGPACGGGGGGGTGFTPTTTGGPGGGGGGGGGPVWSNSYPAVPFTNVTSITAPASVFCSMGNAYIPGSTTTLVPQPANGDYSSFQYSWDFGDPGSGTWSTNGLSKNTATGFTAAHIYETPGTYTITGMVTDNAGVSTVFTQIITVAAFSGTTYYISSSGGSDANDGLSPATAWQTVGKAFANMATNRRFLFNRGDSFSTPGDHNVDPPGPGFIGAYGSGNQPLINITGTNGGVRFRTNDWVIADLEFSGLGVADQGSAILFEGTKQISRILIQRLTVHDFRVDIGWTDWPTMYSTPHDGNTVAECICSVPQVNGFYLGGKRLALLGNIVRDSATSHITRVWQAHQAVIAHNQFLRPGTDRHSLKLLGPVYGDGRPESQFVTVSDNTFQGQVWAVVIGPEDTIHDERVSQVIFERNTNLVTTQTQASCVVKAREVTVRNNVFIGTSGSNFYTAVGVGQSTGLEPPAMNIRVLNNTVYRGDAGSQFSVVSFDVRCSDVTVKNNIASATLVPSMFVTTGACPNLVSDHNLLTLTPGFANAAGGDFHLNAGSPAVDTGVDLVQVKTDFDGKIRPVGAVTDLGAFER